MNSLLLFSDEIQNSIATITGEHLAYVQEMHDLSNGQTIPVVVWGKFRGRGVITQLNKDSISLEIALDSSIIEREPTTLIVAIPRPQTQKKIIHLATVLGVKDLHFIRSENTEKSYLESKSLIPHAIKYEIVKGLEQSYDCMPPTITVHKRFRPFIEDVLVTALNSTKEPLKVLCDTAEDPLLCINEDALQSKDSHAFIAIGPEAGWNDFEREAFKSLGFKSVSLGPRILRCETATSVILAQVALIRELCNKPSS